MSSRRTVLVLSSVLILLAAATGGWTQTPAELVGPGFSSGEAAAVLAAREAAAGESFGGETQWTVFHVSRWVPWKTTASPGYAVGKGYIFPTNSTDGDFWTQVDLPAGSSVSTVCWLFNDSNDVGRWELYFTSFESATSGTSPHEVWLDTYVTGLSSVPGYTEVCRSLDPEVIIRQWGDLDQDMTSHYLSYALLASTTGASGSSLSLFGAAVGWSRTISPAPAVATFNDVPVGAFAFQHIEALAASGITAGCGGGNFCPDTPLTRAQMAVFLAKALGLHFPQ